MQILTFRENEQPARLLDASQETALALRESGLLEVTPGPNNLWQLNTKVSVVGAVRIGDLEVRVTPKAPFSSILFMLGYAKDPGFQPDQVQGTKTEDLWPMLAQTLARLASQALERGVLQGYVTVEEPLSVVRGRILVGQQMARRPGQPIPLEVRYDDYGVDIAENQILRAAIKGMLLVPGISQGDYSALMHLDGKLGAVTLLHAGMPRPFWQTNRLNQRYLQVLQLAEIILDNLGLDVAPGGQAVASFVVDMAKVFEDFVGTALKEAFAQISDGTTQLQYHDVMDEGRQIDIRPDIVHVRGGRPVAVFDAKYKLVSDGGGFPNADAYQALAYATALELPVCYLIYAGERGVAEEGPKEFLIRNSEKRVVTWPLNFAQPCRHLLLSVRELINQRAIEL